MFPSYQIAIAPFQFSYRIGLLFPLVQIFYGLIFVTEGGWNAPILKVMFYKEIKVYYKRKQLKLKLPDRKL